MAYVIRTFYPETPISESKAELTGLYRSVLDSKRVLLLMDNAADDKEQVEPLIPPSTCLLLLTSRSRFTLPGMIDRDLDKMSEEDARDFLLRIAQRIGAAANEIAHLCGRLPLALRLAGSALAERPNLSPFDYIRRFKSGKEKLEAVETSIKTSYSLLPEEQRLLWRKLAVFPKTFDVKSGAAIWLLEIDEAEGYLGELVRNSLVEWEEAEGRYYLHDLARSFAQKQMSPLENFETKKLHAEHFLEVLQLADSLNKKGGTGIQLGLSVFDQEWSNIQDGQAWAAIQFCSNNKAAARLCSGYPDMATYFLTIRRHARERIQWREIGLTASRLLEDRAAESRHLGNLGLAYSDLGETQRAIELAEASLKIARDIADRGIESKLLSNLGLAYKNLGDMWKSMELYNQCLTMARELRDRRLEGIALSGLGTAYKNLGELPRARESYEQQLMISREIGDRRGEGNALGGLGLAHAMLGEAVLAIEFHQQCLAIAREMGDKRGEGRVLGNLGNAYAALDQLQNAIELYEQQSAIANEIDDRSSKGNALGNLGNAYKRLGEIKRAIKFYEQRLTLACEIGDRRGESIANWNLGLALELEGDLIRAVGLMQACIDYERKIGHPDAEKDTAHLATLLARLAAQQS